MTAVGYSGTPLAKKLGIVPGMHLLTIGAPSEYAGWVAPLPDGSRLVTRAAQTVPAVHLFTTEAAVLAKALVEWRRRIDSDGFFWVSWPKKSSRVQTDITEDTIRELALPLGWVDIKVCAVSEVWSGLKLVVRKSERGS
jgi:Protein of unknown function (DUF3052)